MKNTKIPQYNTSIKIQSRANVREIADVMRDVVRTEAKKQYIQDIAKNLCISSREPNYTAVILCNFAYNTATFEPDAHGVQVIKTPAALIREKKGNCVDYTVLISSIAHAAGIPAIIKVVAIGNSENYGHVYPVINGFACDVVPYQRQDGSEHLYRSGNEVVFPIEEKYNKFFLLEV
jgi:transglutaminase-like putative cysteine protease